MGKAGLAGKVFLPPNGRVIAAAKMGKNASRQVARKTTVSRTAGIASARGAFMPSSTARMNKTFGAGMARKVSASGEKSFVGGWARSNHSVTNLKRRPAPSKLVGGKAMSRMVVGGLAAAGIVGAFKNNSGRAADKMGRGRPTGVYGY